jgi:hypothetical protein
VAEEMKGRVVGGEGKEAEVYGGYFGGYVKPANQKEYRRDRGFARNQNGKGSILMTASTCIICIRSLSPLLRFVSIFPANSA